MIKLMKNSSAIFLLGGLMTGVAFADQTTTTSPMQMLASHTATPATTTTTTTGTANLQTQPPATPTAMPAQTTTTTLQSTQPQPVVTPAPASLPAQTAQAIQPMNNNTMATESAPSSSQTPAQPTVVDCSYVVPEPISQMSADTIVQWANYAAVKTFTYDFQNYDTQFAELKPCYTSVGWDSFMGAMKSSNNLKAAQDEHLFVSAKINGQSQLTAQSSGNEPQAWVVRVPVNVIYQNQDREVSQDMYIDLTIKTIYGSPVHLGVNQIIASPKSAAK